MGAAVPELLLDALEASVEVIDAADHGFALGGKPGDDQRDRSAQIRRHDLRTSQPLDAGHHGSVAPEIDAGAEPRKLLHMHEAVLEDRLAYGRGALRHAHQRDELRLQVSREPWEGLGVDGDRAKAATVPRNAEARRRLFDLDAARAQEGKRTFQEIGAG